MMRYSCFVLAAALILLTSGCNTPRSRKGFVKYELKSFKKSVGDTTGLKGGFAKASLRFPLFTDAIDKSTLDILNNYVKNQILTAQFKEGRYKTPEFFMEGFLAEYVNAVGKDPRGTSVVWTIDRSVEITFLNDKFICFSFYESSFLGGAHPNTNIFFSVFDLVSGRKLNPVDFFVEGFNDKLTAIAERKFREVRGLKPDESLEQQGFQFAGDKFALNKNFGFTGKGVVFLYNAYEVAPYAFGITEVVLPFNEIKDLFKRNCIH